MKKKRMFFAVIVTAMFAVVGCAKDEKSMRVSQVSDEPEEVLLEMSSKCLLVSVEEYGSGYRISFRIKSSSAGDDGEGCIQDVYLSKSDVSEFDNQTRFLKIVFKDGRTCTLHYSSWLDVSVDRNCVYFDETLSKQAISFTIADNYPEIMEITMEGCDRYVSFDVEMDDDGKKGKIFLTPLTRGYFTCEATVIFSNSERKKEFPVQIICDEFRFSDGTVTKSFDFAEYERFFELQLSRQDRSIQVSIPPDCSSWIQARVSHQRINGIDCTYVSFLLRENVSDKPRDARITLSRDSTSRMLTIDIRQKGYGCDGSFRRGLEAFYGALNGESWIRSDGWCTDCPVFEWYGLIPSMICSKTLFGEEGYVYSGTEDRWSLDLSANNMRGKIPMEFWKTCRYFESIRICAEYLPDSSVPDIVWHDNLLLLDLSTTFMNVPLGRSVADAKNLRSLDIQSCCVNGNIPDEITTLTSLEYINMRECSIFGSIPSSIGSLTDLEELYLDHNMDLGGTIPDSFYTLENLKNIDISATRIGGSLSPSIINLPLLEEFAITGCEFTGTVPEEFGMLDNLSNYDFDGNYFTELPEFIRYFGFNARPNKEWVGSAGFPLGVPYHQRDIRDGRPDNYIVTVDNAVVINEILVGGEPLKRPGYYVDFDLCHELPFPVWANIRYGMYSWSRGYIDEMKYPVYPTADDLQYPADEYFYDGSAWRHPKLQYPAREYIYDRTAWVHDPNCPWDKEYTDSNGR